MGIVSCTLTTGIEMPTGQPHGKGFVEAVDPKDSRVLLLPLPKRLLRLQSRHIPHRQIPRFKKQGKESRTIRFQQANWRRNAL